MSKDFKRCPGFACKAKERIKCHEQDIIILKSKQINNKNNDNDKLIIRSK